MSHSYSGTWTGCMHCSTACACASLVHVHVHVQCEHSRVQSDIKLYQFDSTALEFFDIPLFIYQSHYSKLKEICYHR